MVHTRYTENHSILSGVMSFGFENRVILWPHWDTNLEKIYFYLYIHYNECGLFFSIGCKDCITTNQHHNFSPYYKGEQRQQNITPYRKSVSIARLHQGHWIGVCSVPVWFHKSVPSSNKHLEWWLIRLELPEHLSTNQNRVFKKTMVYSKYK